MTCIICMDSLLNNNNYIKSNKCRFITKKNTKNNIKLKCGHIFHKNCILDWFYNAKLNSDKCPICRKVIRFKESSLNKSRYIIRKKKIIKKIVERANIRIEIEQNSSLNQTNYNTISNILPENNVYNYNVLPNSVLQMSEYISDIRNLYNDLNLIPHVNDSDFILDLMDDFNIINQEINHLRNYIIYGAEYFDMPNLINSDETVSLNDIFSNTEVDDSYILNDTSSNSSSNIDYEELCEDEKLSNDMGICIGCNIQNIKQKKLDYKNKNKLYKTESNLKKKKKIFYYKNNNNYKSSNKKKLKYYI